MVKVEMDSILRKCIKKMLIFTVGATVGTLAGMYVPVLLCDVWRIQCVICR